MAGGPIAAGTTLTMERVLPLTQVTSLDNQGNQYPATIEAALDTLCMQIQQINQAAQLSLKIPVSDTQGTDTLLPSAQIRANNVLAFDALGAPIVISAASIASGGLSYYDNLTIIGSAQTAPIAFVSLNAVGPDSHIGINYNAKGTTITGLQFNGLGPQNTGTHDFYCNGVKALTITDTYWNPNLVWGGPPDGGIVISSGSSSGGVETSAVVSAQIFNSTTATGASLRLFAQGTSGQIHLGTNGQIGVTINGITTNPVGLNQFSTPNSIVLSGSSSGSGQPCFISVGTSPEARSGDAATNLLFYTGGTGGYIFAADNNSSTICQFTRTANAVQYVNIQGAVSGSNAIVWCGGPTGTNRLTLAGANTDSVDICNGGNFNGTSACAPICRFFGVFEPADYLTINGSSGVGTGPTIGVGTSNGDTNAPLNLSSLGTGNINFFSNTSGTALVSILNNGIINTINSGAFIANGSVATVLGSLGPAGSHTTVQEWLQWEHNGTIRFIPLF